MGIVRMKRAPAVAALVTFGLLAAGLAEAQRRRRVVTHEQNENQWPLDPELPEDGFTFARVRYPSWGGRGWGGGGWLTDYPESDHNFSWRLHQLTSLNVHPDGSIVELTDEALLDHPFLYMIEPGRMELGDEEVAALRRYLLAGGFMMVDDFWGEREWDNFYEQIKRVFPDREPVELDISHPIFHMVFDVKEKPQVPSIHHWWGSGETWERPDAREPHYRAIFDDKGRMMVIICHNTDLGDGWEREGLDPAYFKQFAEKKAYPMGLNILLYAMTH